MVKVYCVIYFPALRKAVCLDRGYNFITDDRAIWGSVSLKDIIETDDDFYAGQMLPTWANDAVKDGYIHVAMWTDFYEDDGKVSVGPYKEEADGS